MNRRSRTTWHEGGRHFHPQLLVAKHNWTQLSKLRLSALKSGRKHCPRWQPVLRRGHEGHSTLGLVTRSLITNEDTRLVHSTASAKRVCAGGCSLQFLLVRQSCGCLRRLLYLSFLCGLFLSLLDQHLLAQQISLLLCEFQG